MIQSLLMMKHEMSLVLLIVLLLIIKITKPEIDNGLVIGWMNVLLLINFIAGFLFPSTGILFNGMYRTTELLAFEKNILNFGTMLVCFQAADWLKKHHHVIEFYLLLLSTLTGMFFMLSSGNLLMFYLALELSTIPLAALANFDLDKRISGEGAMKMIFSSAFSSGLLLFGISLLYGATGTFRFDELPAMLDGSPLQVLAFIFLFTGFAFKLSVVPFHLWTADVYEGSPVCIAAYLSVISKGSIVFVMTSVLYSVFGPMAGVWYNVLAISAVLTMTIGNLFALRQDNLKRFLAFSSIAQVGFILVGISGSSPEGMTSSIYFMVIYIFSNLGAFSVVAFISSQTGKETINDYKGLYKTNPALSWILAISLFSLAGIPPTAGFFGKLFLLTAGAGTGNYALIVIAALNMVVSLAYYLRIIRAIFMDQNDLPIPRLVSTASSMTGFILCIAGILLIGFAGGLLEYIRTISFGL